MNQQDHDYMHAHGIEHSHDTVEGHDHEYMHAHGIEHTHDHEYMHEHGIAHTHEHDHDHAPDHHHEHTHDHSHCEGHEGCGYDCAGCENIDPRAELIALMKYMVGHNASHANELAQLAGKLNEMGETTAYEQVMLAVSDFEKGNMRLSTVLAALNA